MKKLLLTYLTLPFLLSGVTMPFNQPESQKINFVDEQKIAQAHKSCQWQVTKDRAVSAIIVSGIVAAVIGGLYYKFGPKTAISATPAPDASVPIILPHTAVTVEEIFAPLPGMPAEINPLVDAATTDDMHLRAILGHVFTLKQNEQLRAQAAALPQFNTNAAGTPFLTNC